jgi:hypothetical protein
LMQIPPSDRQEVMKAIPLRTLLSELEKRRFTGYCAMPIAGASALLVVDQGRWVLAEYRGIRGGDALRAIRSIGDVPVDVVIGPSEKAQVATMMRTNEPYLVEPPRQPGVPAPEVAPSTTVIRPVSIGGGPGRTVKVIAVTGRKEEPAARPAVAGVKGKGHAQKPVAGKAGQSGERLDRKGLEHLKTMRDSFKDDAADLLSELNLGHLAVNRPKSDKANEGEGGEKSGTG